MGASLCRLCTPLQPRKVRLLILLLSEAFTKPFDGNVEPDLILETEAIGDGFRRAENPDFSSRDLPFLYAEVERVTRESHDPNGGRSDPWCPGLHVDRNPDLMGEAGFRFGGECLCLSSHMGIPAPAEDFNQNCAEFLKTDLDTGLIFASIALDAGEDLRKRQRNQANARKAHDTIARLRRRLALTDSDAQYIEEKPGRLKDSLGDSEEFRDALPPPAKIKGSRFLFKARSVCSTPINDN